MKKEKAAPEIDQWVSRELPFILELEQESENAKNVKLFDVANRQWLVQQLNYFEEATGTYNKFLRWLELFSIRRLLGAIFRPL